MQLAQQCTATDQALITAAFRGPLQAFKLLNDTTTANISNASSVAAASVAEPSSGARQPDSPQIGRPESDDSAAQHIIAEAGSTWDGSLEAPLPDSSDAQLPRFFSDSYADALPSTAHSYQKHLLSQMKCHSLYAVQAAHS